MPQHNEKVLLIISTAHPITMSIATEPFPADAALK
jgi:hypothetical protein